MRWLKGNFSLSIKCLSLKVFDADDSKVWSIGQQGTLLNLSQPTWPLPPQWIKKLFKALWKSCCPWRVNILMWIMLYGSLNRAEIPQAGASSLRFALSVWMLMSLCFISSCFAPIPPIVGAVSSPSLILLGSLMPPSAPQCFSHWRVHLYLRNHGWFG